MTAQLPQRRGALTAISGLSSDRLEPFKALPKARQGLKGWSACCPAHKDGSPSLWFTEDGDRIGFHCHAGCEPDDILKAMGLTWRDIYGDTLTPAVRTEYRRKTLLAAREVAQMRRAFDSPANHEAHPSEIQEFLAKANQDVARIDRELAELEGTPPAPRFCATDAKQLSAAAKAPQFLIDGMLETDSHGIMGGASMTFKSFIALRMAYSVCTGQPFMGRKVYQPGRVLYVCGEGEGAIARRIKAMEQKLGELPAGVMQVIPGGIRIDDPVDMRALAEYLGEFKPALVIFDTFASLCGNTDENSPSSVGPALRMIKETCQAGKSSSLIVHHFGKDADRGFRGASNFTNDVDFAYKASRDGDNLRTTLLCHKSKDSEPFKPFSVEMEKVQLEGLSDQDGRPVYSLVAELGAEVDMAAASEAGGPEWARALQALKICYEGQKVNLELSGRPSSNPPVTWKDWNQTMRDMGLKNPSRAKATLIERGQIECLAGDQFRPKP